MNSLVKNRIGERHGRLVVVGFAGSAAPKYNAKWHCACDCGNKTIAVGHKLGKEKFSCGCLHNEKTALINKTHGEAHGKSKTVLYVAWCNMKSRCKPEWVEPWNYFDRGITVCTEWKNSYTAFRDWVLKNIGERPDSNHSIDRIDNDLGYFPGNIRWATKSRQLRNTRFTRRDTRTKEGKPLKDLCEENGYSFPFIVGRICSGWTLHDALSIPKYVRRKTYYGH